MLNIFKNKKTKQNKDKPKNIFEIELTECILGYEVARADGNISKNELFSLETEINKISTKVNKAPEEILGIIEIYSANSISFYEFIEDINKEYTKDEKLSLITFLWNVAYADNILEVNEERLIRRISDLINIKDLEVLKLKDQSKSHKLD